MKFEWEWIEGNTDMVGIINTTHRAKVIGGWIVKNYFMEKMTNSISCTSVFISDPNHEWSIEK